MRTYSAVIERCPQTRVFVGFVSGFPGAHSQGETVDELVRNLHEVVELLSKDGEPQPVRWAKRSVPTGSLVPLTS
jgi:predicted RNase H-like HicB family nuclease